MAKETKREVQPAMADDAVTKKKTGAQNKHIDDDAGEQGVGHDGDAKKKATKGFTARNNNDDDKKDRNPDTKGGMKTKDPEFKKAGKKGENEGSDQQSNWDEPKAEKTKTKVNNQKDAGKDKPKKKSSEKESK